MKAIETKPFADLVGKDVIAFVFERAPQNVATRVARALDHYTRAPLVAGSNPAPQPNIKNLAALTLV